MPPGEGEFGIVHKAMWCGTLVAAKILKTSSSIALGDFRSEIEVLRRVHHPNARAGACALWIAERTDHNRRMAGRTHLEMRVTPLR